MDKQKLKRLKFACYTSSLTMSAVSNLSPILFLTFRQNYDISFTSLGLLVAINFVTQLGIDLIFSFFSHKFNITKVIRFMPCLGVIGIIIYGLSPFVFPNSVYLGLVIGTLVFSASCGLAEVLISPIIAAIPSKDPDREMSKLHSVYAWGVVFVIIISTLCLYLVGMDNWFVLPFVFSLLPLCSAIAFSKAQIPSLETPKKTSGALQFFKRPILWLCVFAIFLGGASELIMAQWCSGYLEKALSIPKVWGDIFGTAIFGLTLAIARTLYAKKGKNLGTILFLGAIGSTVCYLVASVSNIAFIGLMACAFTGFFVSMMWPGTLVVAETKMSDGGVFVFAIMAAGGDLGASVGPQLVGIVTDNVIISPWSMELAQRLNITVEQLGMKIGMLSGTIFPAMAIIAYYLVKKSLKKQN